MIRAGRRTSRLLSRGGMLLASLTSPANPRCRDRGTDEPCLGELFCR